MDANTEPRWGRREAGGGGQAGLTPGPAFAWGSSRAGLAVDGGALGLDWELLVVG